MRPFGVHLDGVDFLFGHAAAVEDGDFLDFGEVHHRGVFFRPGVASRHAPIAGHISWRNLLDIDAARKSLLERTAQQLDAAPKQRFDRCIAGQQQVDRGHVATIGRRQTAHFEAAFVPNGMRGVDLQRLVSRGEVRIEQPIDDGVVALDHRPSAQVHLANVFRVLVGVEPQCFVVELRAFGIDIEVDHGVNKIDGNAIDVLIGAHQRPQSIIFGGGRRNDHFGHVAHRLAEPNGVARGGQFALIRQMRDAHAGNGLGQRGTAVFVGHRKEFAARSIGDEYVGDGRAIEAIGDPQRALGAGRQCAQPEQ